MSSEQKELQVLHAKVWEYKGHLLCSATTAVSIDGETIRPSDRRALGCVTFQTEKFLGVSPEAFELMKTIKSSADEVSHIDWFVSSKGESVFAWLGALNVVMDPKQVEGAANFAVREGRYVPIPNDPPEEAKAYVDSLLEKAVLDTPPQPLWSAEEE